MAFTCLCSYPSQWPQCIHECCVAAQRRWKHYLNHDPSSSCKECLVFMEEIQAHVKECLKGASCPVVSVLRLPFAAAPQPTEGRSPVSSGQQTPGNDSGCGQSGRSSVSNLSAEQEGLQSPPGGVPNHVHPMEEMASINSDETYITAYSSGFLMPPSVSSYNTAPSMFSPDSLSRQNSDRPTSLHRSLTPIGEESTRASTSAASWRVQEEVSHSVQFLPEVAASLSSISQLRHFGTTPLPSPFPVQEIVHPLDPRYLTCNPMDGEYHKFRDYVFQGEIGDGGQGTCFYATDRMLEKTFAYKENYRSIDDTKLLAECAMMSQINHDNVVVFLGAVREDMSKVKLFMELAECGSVHHVFSDNPHLQTNTLLIAHLLQQLLSAVNHLHQNNILHRDIKGKNLLLFDGCVCKLADFGMAVHLDDCRGVQDAGVKGTYPFLSPEYMREQVYQFSADVWSSMAVAVEMMTGKDPWSAVNQDALVLIIGNYRARDHFHQLVPQQELEQRVKEAEQAEDGDLVMWYFHALVDMMKKVFVEEHVRRPTAQDLLCEDVMLKAPNIYDDEGEDEAHTSYEGVPEPGTPGHLQPSLERDSDVGRGTELDGAGLHNQVFLQPRSFLHSHPEYQSIHSWPKSASDAMSTALLSSYPGPPHVVMTDQGVLIPGGRIIKIVNKRRVTIPAPKRYFQRAFSQHESLPTRSQFRDPSLGEGLMEESKGKRPVRRHSLAELYVMTGPEADHEP